MGGTGRYWFAAVAVFVGVPAAARADTWTGEVYDVRSGNVVAAALLRLGGEETVSGPDGGFKFVAAPEGRRKLVATAAGYAVTVMDVVSAGAAAAGWLNVPLMPRATAGPGRGDFLDVFLARAPLREVYPGYVVAARLPGLPRLVGVNGGDNDVAAVSNMIGELNERWGTGVLAPADGSEAPDVTLTFGAAPEFVITDGAGARGSFAGGAAENSALVAAFLRRWVLAIGRPGGALTEGELEADVPRADDLDGVVEIIYREREDFNYAVFRPRRPSAASVLADLYLGIGGYGAHGVTDGSGRPVDFPVDYQLGQFTVAGGFDYKNVWAKAGWWFAGIWNADAEAAYAAQAPASKVLRRNSSAYYRAGYRIRPPGPATVAPFGGYRKLAVHGKFAPAVGADAAAARDPRDLDYTNHYDGAEAGVRADAVFGWFGIAAFGEYARVFNADAYNLAEVGVGAARPGGAGTFIFGRFYWGPRFDYAFGGVVLTFDVPLSM